MDSLIKLLQSKFKPVAQNFQNSPLGALTQGKPQQFMPKLQQQISDANARLDPHGMPGDQISYVKNPIWGNMQKVNPQYNQRMQQFAGSFAGDMQAVNPGGFAGALPFNTRVDQMTSAPMKGPPIARPGFNQIKSITPNQQNIGQMQVAHQMPDLTVYEQALGKGGQAPNFTILERISAMHPGDARFMIHKTLLPGINKIPL